MGTGNRVAAEINSGRYAKSFNFSHTDRYTTIDEVQRTVSLGYRDVTQFTSAASDFDTESVTSVSTTTGRSPSSSTCGVGVTAQRSELVTTTGGSAEQAVDCAQQRQSESHLPSRRSATTCTDPFEFEVVSSKFDAYELQPRLALRLAQPRDLRRPRHASPLQHRLHTAGQRGRVLVRLVRLLCSSCRSGASSRSCSTPSSRTVAHSATPRRCRLTVSISRGGPDSVRGYRESRLGPKDNFGRPYGGNIKTVAQTELLLPIPEKWRNSARFSLFFDIGNIFSDQNIVFRAPNLHPATRTSSPRKSIMGSSIVSSGSRSAWPCNGWRRWACSASATPCLLNDKRGDTDTRWGMRSRASSSRSARRSDNHYSSIEVNPTWHVRVLSSMIASPILAGLRCSLRSARGACRDEDRGGERSAAAGRSAAGQVGDAGVAGRNSRRARRRSWPSRRTSRRRKTSSTATARSWPRTERRNAEKDLRDGPARAGAQAERVRRRI